MPTRKTRYRYPSELDRQLGPPVDLPADEDDLRQNVAKWRLLQLLPTAEHRFLGDESIDAWRATNANLAEETLAGDQDALLNLLRRDPRLYASDFVVQRVIRLKLDMLMRTHTMAKATKKSIDDLLAAQRQPPLNRLKRAKDARESLTKIANAMLFIRSYETPIPGPSAFLASWLAIRDQLEKGLEAVLARPSRHPKKSNEEIAKETGASVSNLVVMATGKRIPETMVHRELARKYGCSVTTVTSWLREFRDREAVDTPLQKKKTKKELAAEKREKDGRLTEADKIQKAKVETARKKVKKARKKVKKARKKVKKARNAAIGTAAKKGKVARKKGKKKKTTKGSA